MLENMKLTKSRAASIFQTFEPPIFLGTPKLDKVGGQLKAELISIHENLKLDVGSIKTKYDYDLYFGLQMYELLNNNYKFNERLAAQEDIWRFLSINVIPEIVYDRHELSEIYFYKINRRIWLRSIWWYIHLSWQGSAEDTIQILKNNNTDTILQLVDRKGKYGYKLELTRKLMKKYEEHEYKDTRNFFRRVMKLNTVRLQVIEPELQVGGIDTYLVEIFEYVSKTPLEMGLLYE